MLHNEQPDWTTCNSIVYNSDMSFSADIRMASQWLRWPMVTFLAMCAPWAFSEPIQIQGTRVTLTPPEGFESSLYFPGVQHKEMTAAIVVNEIPSSFIAFSRQYSSAGLKKAKMELLSREHIEKDGLSGQILSVNQTLRGVKYERWMLITGDTAESVIIAGYFPATKAKELRETIQTTLRDSIWDSARDLDHFDGLGFRIDDVPSLRVVTRMSNSLVFTETGRMPDLYYTDALLMMSLKQVPEDAKLNEKFALGQFKRISLLEEPELGLMQSKTFASVPGVIIEGTGRHKHLGYQVAVMQIILETESGFFIAQGFTKIDDRENDFDVFRATIGSFRLEKARETS